MKTIPVTFNLDSSDYTAPLGFEVWLDDTQLVNIDHVTESQQVSMEISDDADGAHELRLVMKNKTQEHTVLDDTGNIVSNAMLSITNIKFDQITMDYTFSKTSVYHHDFNGSAAAVEDKFFGNMGCNGSVSLKFSTPVYLWLLENV
jgi:hypothetical protein